MIVEVEFIDRAEPSRAEPSRAEPSRAEPSRAEPSRTTQLRYVVHVDASEHFECPDRVTAIAKYDEMLGSVIGDLPAPISR